MLKIIAAVALLITLGTAQAQDLAPEQALPVCAGVYGTVSMYGSAQAQAFWTARARRVLNLAGTYNPNAGAIAGRLMERNITRFKANDPTIADEVGGALDYCNRYVARYGI